MTARRKLLWIAAWLLIAGLVTAWVSGEVPRQLNRLDIQGISLARPAWLWAAALAWLVPLTAAWSLTDLSKWQQVLQNLLRMALIATLALAAAGPRLLREQPRRAQVVHLIDRSESVPDALLQAAAAGVRASQIEARQREAARPVALADVRDVPPVSVVLFDGQATRLPWSATSTELPVLTRDPTSGRDTDLAAALNLALGLFDGHSVPQLVIWSDGIETRGDATELVTALKTAGVRVDLPALPPLPATGELVLEKIEVPQTVRAGVPFPVAIAVRTTAPVTVQCRVTSGDQAPVAVQKQLPTGATRLDLGELRLRKGGPAELAAACEVLTGQDRFAGNNQLRSRVVVQERPKILYVEGAQGQSQYLVRALIDDFEVDAVPADGLPRSLAGMVRYQGIVLSDVPRVSSAGVPLLTDGDMRNLDAYARQGGGLLVVGGENSLGSGGYQDTYLDKHTLPVRLDVESTVEAPTLAIMLCIDKSGSMQGTKMELAKEAGRATAKALNPEDRIGVIAFDSEARVAVRLQRASNSYRIDTDIGKLQPSGGTHIYPALDQAYQILLQTQAKIKHVIVLTDGQAPRQGMDTLVRQMRKSGITVSSVGVGTDVDRSMLEAIADRGGGRAYFTDRPETLPRIFVKETKLIAGQSVVEKTVRARLVASGRIDLLHGVHIEQAPVLTGFLPTKVKPGAEEILRTSAGAPLLVRWRLGEGKVSVWTSDLKNRWAAAWLDWPGYAILARQLVRDLMKETLGAQVAVQLLRERDQLRVAVDAVDEDDAYMPGLQGLAEVQRPDGTKVTIPLPEVAVGRYETTLPLDQLGPYDVLATVRAGPDKPVLASGRATAVHPYPDEYRLPDPGASVLQQLVRATGGRLDSKPADWLDDRGLVHKDQTWLWPDLARLALLLLIVDVLLRRVRLGRAPSTRWHALRRGGGRKVG
jgi:Ca-activated chloride channel family protein